ncbi:MAG: hypothetical protein ABUR63_10740 [Verrucomicrobiota bacterium]
MSACPCRWTSIGLAIAAGLAGVVGRADAQMGGAAPTASQMVSGTSSCPLAGDVAQRLGDLIPRGPGDPRTRPQASAPAQIVDLGDAFQVSVGDRSREYQDPNRDCARRAQFAAVFIALIWRRPEPSAPASPAPPPVPPTASVPAAPAPPPAPPRARADLGATAATDLGSGAATIAPAAALRFGFGRRRLIPVVGLSGQLPVDATLDGVNTRRWSAAADVDLRAALRPRGRAAGYLEVGVVGARMSARPLNLAVARSQTAYAFGPRLAAGVVFGRARLSPFVLVAAEWFPAPPSISALPNGVLGHTASFSIGLTAGVSWGWL